MGDLDVVGVVEDILGLQGFEAAALALAGVVDQHVDAAPGFGDLIDEGTAAVLRTSSATAMTSAAPSTRMSSATADSVSGLREQIASRTPSRAKAAAVARPIPRLAPVTITRLALRSICMSDVSSKLLTSCPMSIFSSQNSGFCLVYFPKAGRTRFARRGDAS
jgi:hypothetical protein